MTSNVSGLSAVSASAADQAAPAFRFFAAADTAVRRIVSDALAAKYDGAPASTTDAEADRIAAYTAAALRPGNPGAADAAAAIDAALSGQIAPAARVRIVAQVPRMRPALWATFCAEQAPSLAFTLAAMDAALSDDEGGEAEAVRHFARARQLAPAGNGGR